MLPLEVEQLLVRRSMGFEQRVGRELLRGRPLKGEQLQAVGRDS